MFIVTTIKNIKRNRVGRMRNFIMLHQIIYVVITFFCEKTSALRLLDHVQTHKPVPGRTHLNEWSPTQHTTNTRGEHPYSQRASNRLFQQSSGCRPTP